MKRFAYILAAAALLAWAEDYETVPQTTGEKYIFTRPRHPDGIKGRIIGSPAKYRLIRSEDVDWLTEAFAERAALLAGTMNTNAWEATEGEFGRWSIIMVKQGGWQTFDTAQFLFPGDIVTSNAIARFKTVTNKLGHTMARIEHPGFNTYSIYSNMDAKRHGRETCWVDGEPTPTETKYIRKEAYTNSYSFAIEFPSITNIYDTVTTNWTSGALVTNISYITMAMTNGTTSVHTNLWTEIKPVEERHTVTNITPFSWAGLLWTNGAVSVWAPELPRNPLLQMAGYLTNMLNLAKGCTRILRETPGSSCTTTAEVATWSGGETWDITQSYTNYTNEEHTVHSIVGLAHAQRGTHATTYTGGDTLGTRSRSGATGSAQYIIDPKIQHILMTTGGVTRVESVDVYLGVDVEHRKWAHVTEEPFLGHGITERAGSVHHAGTATFYAEDDAGNALFALTANPMDALDAGIGSSGISFPSGMWTVQLEGGDQAEEWYHAYISWIGLILNVKPGTSADSWE